MGKRTSGKPAGARKRKALLYITGESPLVEEYGGHCADKGYDVFIQWNPSEGKKLKSGAKFRQSNIIPSRTVLALELTIADLHQKRKNLQKIDKALPATGAILSSSVTVTASEQATWIDKKHRLVGIGALPTFTGKDLVEVAPTIHSPKETLEVVQTFFASLGTRIEVVQDRVGMVLPRIVCQIINEAAFALQEDVASPADIDTAMKLGVNYPSGPIELADKIGFRHVYAVLTALERDLREDRYRVAPLLKQMAESGEWWKPS